MDHIDNISKTKLEMEMDRIEKQWEKFKRRLFALLVIVGAVAFYWFCFTLIEG